MSINKLTYQKKKKSQCGSCDTVSHTVYPLVYISLIVFIAMSHWFKASSFCYTLYTGHSLGCLLDILLFPQVTEILQLWIYRSGPFTCSSSSPLRWMLRWANSQSRFGAWVVAELVRPQFLLIDTTMASSEHCPSQLNHCNKKQGVGLALLLSYPQEGLTCTCTTRTRSIVLPRQESAFLRLSFGKVQGQFIHSCNPWSLLQPATGDKGCGMKEGISLQSTLPYGR